MVELALWIILIHLYLFIYFQVTTLKSHRSEPSESTPRWDVQDYNMALWNGMKMTFEEAHFLLCSLNGYAAAIRLRCFITSGWLYKGSYGVSHDLLEDQTSLSWECFFFTALTHTVGSLSLAWGMASWRRPCGEAHCSSRIWHTHAHTFFSLPLQSHLSPKKTLSAQTHSSKINLILGIAVFIIIIPTNKWPMPFVG